MLCHIPHTINKDAGWIFFVHGLGGNSNIFYKQVEAYKPHFNLMFVDLFGHGCTLEQLHEYTFETLAEGVGQVMAEQDIDSAHMVGVSLGTIILEAFCLIAPERIKSLVLSGAVQGYDRRAKFLLRTGALLQHVMPYMMLYRLFAFIMMPKRNHAASRHFFIREAKNLGGHEFRKWYRLMTSLEPFYTRFPDRRRNTIPRLYVSGDEDHLFMPFVIRNALPDPLASIHIIEKCGHVCNIENAEEFNRVSLEYLKNYPAAPKLKNIPKNSRARRIAMRCGTFAEGPVRI